MSHAGPILHGARIRLRPFGEADVTDAYLGWLSDPEVVRFSNQRFRTHDRETALAYLGTFAGGANLFLGIEAQNLGRLIGTMTVYRAVAHGTADIGIMVGDRDAKGGGYGQEAWDLLLIWLLEQPDIRKVTCGTLAANRAMVRLAERSGMQPDGTRAAQEIVDGVPVDIVHYARFKPR